MEIQRQGGLIAFFCLFFFFFFPSRIADASCLFPDFSHRSSETSVWIQSRGIHYPLENQESRDWSKYGIISSGSSLQSSSEKNDICNKYLDWVHGQQGENFNKIKRFYTTSKEMPNIIFGRSANLRYQKQISIATSKLLPGDNLLKIHISNCLTDIILSNDPLSLKEAPWELRLATKILRERAKGQHSEWYFFIRLLPNTITSPLFFSDSELRNIEDSSIIDEIWAIRGFADVSYASLIEEEKAGSKFEEFVWALALVYTFSCRLETKNELNADVEKSLHAIVPFVGELSDLSGKVRLSYTGDSLNLFIDHEVGRGSVLDIKSDVRNLSAAFVYRGLVPGSISSNRIKIFKDLQDMVEWYFNTFGGVYNNIYTTQKIAEEAVRSSVIHGQDLNVGRGCYSVGLDGYIDSHMLQILATLREVTYVSNRENKTYSFEPFIEVAPEDSSFWRERFRGIAEESVGLGRLLSSRCKDRLIIAESAYGEAFEFSLLALQSRIEVLLTSHSTSIEEDEALLSAASWEGFRDYSDGHACPTCQWLTDELSLNDNLALRFRLARKKILLAADRTISCKTKPESHSSLLSIDMSEDSNASIQKFMKWCESQGSFFSEKIAVSFFPDNASDPAMAHVRGVRALQQIDEGESICVLPLSMGLYYNDSASDTGADNWHLAAAKILQEKALGAESKWASYIKILPQSLASPINIDPIYLKEIHWSPVLREVVLVRKAIKDSYTRHRGPLIAWADFKEYKWAATMVHSRAFTLPVKEDEQYASYVMMPFMDMINHHYNYQADWMSLPVRNGKLEIIARNRVSQDHELFASFGPRSNDNLFLYYGFVLEENPFDSAQIFPSFEEAVRWSTSLLSPCCELSWEDITERLNCQICWEKTWGKAKAAIQAYEEGMSEQNKEWWDLVCQWADMGSEFLQFQPGPSIYVKGVADPNLIAGLEVLADSITEGSEDYQHCTEDETGCNLDTSESLKELFDCVERHKWPLVESLRRSTCWRHLVRAVTTENKVARQRRLVAKIVISLRCLQVLNEFPTHIDEDRALIERGSSNPHLHLTWRYRYLKKLFLRSYINELVDSY